MVRNRIAALLVRLMSFSNFSIFFFNTSTTNLGENFIGSFHVSDEILWPTITTNLNPGTRRAWCKEYKRETIHSFAPGIVMKEAARWSNLRILLMPCTYFERKLQGQVGLESHASPLTSCHFTLPPVYTFHPTQQKPRPSVQDRWMARQREILPCNFDD